MANTTNSPNMSLTIPVVGVDPGPQYATDINACLTIIDSHNHTSGNGVAIPTSGLNINADLPINSHNLTTVRTTRFAAAGSFVGSDLACLGVLGVDLYYVDGNGNQIRLTQNGNISGSISTSASCGNYSTNSITFTQVTNLSAAITTDGRPVTLVLIPDGSLNASCIGGTAGGAVAPQTTWRILRSGTEVARGIIQTGSTSSPLSFPLAGVSTIDTPTAGTYTYTVEVETNAGGTTTTAVVQYAKLMARVN